MFCLLSHFSCHLYLQSSFPSPSSRTQRNFAPTTGEAATTIGNNFSHFCALLPFALPRFIPKPHLLLLLLPPYWLAVVSSARDFFSHYRKTRSRFLPRQWLHLASAIGSPVAADAACDWWEAVLGTKFCAACARVGVVALGVGCGGFFRVCCTEWERGALICCGLRWVLQALLMMCKEYEWDKAAIVVTAFKEGFFNLDNFIHDYCTLNWVKDEKI